MRYFLFAIFAILGYLLGSLNFSIIIGKLFYKTDVREYGSKNAGATNTLRTLGKIPAFTVLFLDAVKGVIAYFIAYLITKDYVISYVSATAAILGHNFPVFFGFRGGKGVITSLGAIFCLNPIIGGIVLAVAVLLIAVTKFVSLGSIFGAILAISLFFVMDRSLVKIILIFIIAGLLIYRHRSNVSRLIKGNENKITFKKS